MAKSSAIKMLKHFSILFVQLTLQLPLASRIHNFSWLGFNEQSICELIWTRKAIGHQPRSGYDVVYMAIVGSFPFNSFLSGVLSCIGTAVLAVCLRIQVNKENKEFKDLPPERAYADFILSNLVLHLVIMNFLG
ncbi:hypothetical protein KY284_032253 [Solanum tuberosum]|nr:hypothetical protein KY284_032253 [Solanum tuberosum]